MSLLGIFKGLPGNFIESAADLEQAALEYGMLPFFSNSIRGFSVSEMAAPGRLFGGNTGDEGCWEWKGPVLRNGTLAYGKFFKRKAGFVSLELLPDFLNYRRFAYPVKPDSTDEMLLEIIGSYDAFTSTELRSIIKAAMTPDDVMPIIVKEEKGFKRSSLEGPLQRLQMGGHILITDFEYKTTRKGERYGWGVARYALPEVRFGANILLTDRSPEESLEFLTERLAEKLPIGNRKKIRDLLI